MKDACEARGLEFVKKATYKWYGHHVGDYPMPKGFTKADLGKCEYAIRVPGKKDAYEIGVVKRRDGEEGYTFLYDFYSGGKGLVGKLFGDDPLGKSEFQKWNTTYPQRGDTPIRPLMQEYEAQVAEKFARQRVGEGFEFKREYEDNGDLRVRVFRETSGGGGGEHGGTL